MDAANGKIVDKLPIGDGCDGIAFDEKNNLIFTSNGGDGTITVIKELAANKFEAAGSIVTKRGARTIAFDEKTHTLFLPTADFEPADPQNPNARRRMTTGTFQVLAVQ